jgi:hypothetical protein
MKLLPLITIGSLTILALISGGCRTGVLDAQRERLLALSFDQFDQTNGEGFRLLLDQKRHVEAAELIEEYLRRHGRDLTERERVSLSFHAGQLYGIVGDPSKAAPHLKRALYKGEPTPDGHPAYWNAYVDATRAFVTHDRNQLLEARDRMGDLNEGFHRLVDSFIENFDVPYADLIFGQKMKKLPSEDTKSK